MENNQPKEKSYFCHGCKYFTALVMDEDNAGLKSASLDELEKPRLFVLTHCINKDNPDESEGNTKQRTCPLEKLKNN